MLDLLKELCALNGTSGDEKGIADFVLSKISGRDDCTVKIDNIGNVIVSKKGKTAPKNKVMLAAHMDEVGFMVTDINSDGFLSFSAVGGIMPSVVFGRKVVFKSGLCGSIAERPVHHLTKDEREVQPKLDSLYVDIGATSREDAEKSVQRGDCFYFTSEFFEFGDGFVKGKAIDDRAGCAIMLDMIGKDLPYDCTFVFTTQEEIGTRGAGCAAFTVQPDIAIVLESTTACDIPSVEGAKRVCRLKNGTVVSFMDGGTVYDKELYRLGFDTAAENNLKCQTKTKIAGGNDSRSIHKAIGGIRTIALSVPCRYLHSPACVIAKSDYLEMRILAEKLLVKAAEL